MRVWSGRCTSHPPPPPHAFLIYLAFGRSSGRHLLGRMFGGLGVVSRICAGALLVECHPRPHRPNPFALTRAGMQRGGETLLQPVFRSHFGSRGCGALVLALVPQARVCFSHRACALVGVSLFGAPASYRAHCRVRLGHVAATPGQMRTEARIWTVSEGLWQPPLPIILECLGF